MVRALLEGRKTQTRRPMARRWSLVGPGDRFWVRETFQYDVAEMPPVDAGGNPTTAEAFCYAATSDVEMKPWVSPIHMPRRASRLTLVVTAKKIERLHDISVTDAKAEGCEIRQMWLFGLDAKERQALAARVFGALWAEINGKESWDANPQVCALRFTVHRCNVDKMGNV
jgi:hypothetical protein